MAKQKTINKGGAILKLYNVYVNGEIVATDTILKAQHLTKTLQNSHPDAMVEMGRALEEEPTTEKKQTAKEKAIKNYLNIDKRFNAFYLQLDELKWFTIVREGKTEQECYLLGCLEREINALKETIDAYKKELDGQRFAIEENRDGVQ